MSEPTHSARTLGLPPGVGGSQSRIIDERSRFRLWVLVVWLVVLGFAFQGTRGLWQPDEGRYVDVAVNMLATGDYSVPRIDAEHLHFAKPPLIYWAIAASLASIGHSEWAARLPSALAYVLTGLCVALLASTLGLREPMRAAVIWSVTLLPFVAGAVVTTDMLLTAFETLAVLGYLLWRDRSAPAAAHRALWLMWLAFGLAFATKGPPGLLPLLAIVLFEAFIGRRLQALLRPWPMCAFTIVALGWFAYISVRHPQLVRYFAVSEVFDRIATAKHDRNAGWHGLFATYGVVLLVGTLPYLPVLAARSFRRKRPREPRAVGDSRLGFLKWWMFVPFAVFAVAQSRQPLYLVPLSVPFALLVARRFEQSEPSRTWFEYGTLAWAALLLSLKCTAAYWPTERDTRALATALQSRVDLANYQELLFIDRQRPYYGLRFYLGKDIEAVYTARQYGLEYSEPLCERIAASHAPLLLVSRERETEYIDAARRCTRSVAIAGQASGFTLLSFAEPSPAPTRRVAAAAPAVAK